MLPPNIEGIADRALAAVEGGGHAVVSGPVGSGRQSLVDRLAVHDDVAVVLAPDLRATDAIGGLLAGSARAVGCDAADAWAAPDGGVGRELARAFEEFNGLLLVRLAGSVPQMKQGHGSSGRRGYLLQELLRAISRTRRLIWVVDSAGSWERFDVAAEHFSLTRHTVPISDAVAPELSEAIADLERYVQKGVESAPYLWRAAAGAVALGASSRLAAEAATKPHRLAVIGLANLVGCTLAEAPEARAATLRLTTLRRPVERKHLRDYVGATSGWNALSNGLGYGDPVRVHPTLSSVLRDQLTSICTLQERAEAHVGAAALWRRLDGAQSPRALDVGAAGAWVEKVHHLGRGGDATRAEWRAQHKPSPVFYWDVARALSHEKRFAEAAEAYRECISAFPEDPYAHHYLAFNLDKADRDPEAVRHHFERACELDPANEWCNARLVTHLIRTGRWLDARRAWRDAVERIDPDGTRAAGDAWLVAHLHYWVAVAWLDAQAWREAAAVLADLPEGLRIEVADARPGFARLVEQMEDLREAEGRAFDAFVRELGEPWRARVTAVWAVIRERVSGVPVPAVGIKEDEAVLTWSHSGLALELGLESPAGSSWGGHDHLDGLSECGESVDDEVSEALEAWLRRARDHA